MSAKFKAAARTAAAHMLPTWDDQGHAFVYRRHSDNAEFIKVNAVAGTKEVAFDLDTLANALAEHRQEVLLNKQQLLSSRVQPCSNGFRFVFDDKLWFFDPLSKVCEEEPNTDTKIWAALSSSPRSKEKISIQIVNNTQTSLRLNWIGFGGELWEYSVIAPGQSFKQDTYEGHIWTLVSASNGVVVKKFAARQSEPRVTANDSTSEADDATDLSDLSDLTTDMVDVRGNSIHVTRSNKSSYELTAALPDGFRWSDELEVAPDGHLIVAWEQKLEQDHLVHTIDSSPKDRLEPKLKSFQYLKPGDDVEIFRPRLFSLPTGAEIKLTGESFDNPYEITNIGWNKAGDEFRFLYNQRGHQIVRVIGIGRNGSRVIIEEKSDTFINYSSKLYQHSVMETDQLLWASERDGWNRLYLVDMDSGRTQAVTPSRQVVYKVEEVDEKARKLWYSACGVVTDEDPYYRHLICVNFDGSGYQQLTQGDGTHQWSWSPDKRWFVDTWSQVDMTPKSVLRDGSTGEQKMSLETGDMTDLLATGWTVPERFAAPSRDGKYQIYGIIIQPQDFKADKHYPIIEHVYAGPNNIHTPKKFDTLDSYHDLANKGFVVVVIDGMGTNWRSKEFHDVCYKNLKDAGFPDRIAWLKAAAKDRPWMDISRVGIYGGSAGGQNAMGALLFHNDFYKAAVADCGCHDNRMDKIWWNEQWMGWPVDESYEASSNLVNAHRLKGHLMLMLSELDTNVDPSSTMQVVRALNDAEKDYDFVFFPGKGHCDGSASAYGKKRIEQFFRKHLLLQ